MEREEAGEDLLIGGTWEDSLVEDGMRDSEEPEPEWDERLVVCFQALILPTRAQRLTKTEKLQLGWDERVLVFAPKS